MKLYRVWTRGTGPVSTGIAVVCRPHGWDLADVPSHELLLRSDGMGWEAHAHTGGWWWTSRSAIFDWLAEDGGRWAKYWEFPISEALVREISRRADDMCGQWDYDLHQIWRLLLDRGLPSLVVRRTPATIDCSEADARVTAQAQDARVLTGLKKWDRIRPVDTLRALVGQGARIVNGLPDLG